MTDEGYRGVTHLIYRLERGGFALLTNSLDVETKPIHDFMVTSFRCAAMHYGAITRKQHYCQAIAIKKASECNVLHFACIDLHPSFVAH